MTDTPSSGTPRAVKAVFALLAVIAAVTLGRHALGQPEQPRRTVERAASTPATPTGCQLHIELYDAAHWSRELGRPEMWVLANYKIHLWERPAPNTGRKVGEMIPGSRAVIIEQSGDSYRVQSPLDQSVGWISSIQVARTLRQDTETRRPC